MSGDGLEVKRETRKGERGRRDEETHAPTCRPHPNPPVAIKEGADQEPSGSLAITSPVPPRPEKMKPAF